MNNTVKEALVYNLQSLQRAVGRLAELYRLHPELNDQVDIQKIIPMSLDEWEVEIAAKVDHIERAFQ